MVVLLVACMHDAAHPSNSGSCPPGAGWWMLQTSRCQSSLSVSLLHITLSLSVYQPLAMRTSARWTNLSGVLSFLADRLTHQDGDVQPLEYKGKRTVVCPAFS